MSTGYHGHRTAGGLAHVVTPEGRELPPRNDLRDHSPTGFEWGYAGSGPMQLGLALLAHSQANDELALKHYRDFTRMVVATLPEREWRLSLDEIADALTAIRALRGN